MRVLPISLCLALSCGAAMAQEVMDMEVPEGWPWKMGDATVTLDGKVHAYTSYDYSIGAFDAGVQFREHVDCPDDGSCQRTGKVLLSLGLRPGTDAEAKIGAFYASAVFPELPDGPAETSDVSVEWRLEQDYQGRKLMSSGPVQMTLTSVKRGLDGSDSYGHLAGSLTATLCEAVDETLVPGGACQELTVQFESDVQYDSL